MRMWMTSEWFIICFATEWTQKSGEDTNVKTSFVSSSTICWNCSSLQLDWTCTLNYFHCTWNYWSDRGSGPSRIVSMGLNSAFTWAECTCFAVRVVWELTVLSSYSFVQKGTYFYIFVCMYIYMHSLCHYN